MVNFINSTGQTHEGKPRKDKVEGLIEEFDVYPEFAREGVRRAIYITELDRTMYRSKERAIQPPATLRDQLRNLGKRQSSWDPFPRQIGTHLIWRVGDTIRRLDIVKDPCSSSFRYEFPAQDLIKGQYMSEGNIALSCISYVHDPQPSTYLP